jgi:hypothetical protein
VAPAGAAARPLRSDPAPVHRQEEDSMKPTLPRLVTVTLVCLFAFATPPATASSTPENPTTEGIDLRGSDPRANELADKVMERLGGRRAWDETRFLTWNFFGRRRHLWDKLTGDIRVEGVRSETDEPFVILMNLHTGQGRVWIAGEEVTDPELRAQMLDSGEGAWINDGYWMFMPFKLKDTGVTLEYLGERSMVDGRFAEVLQLTFEQVGRTPQNKYHVYVAKDSGLVEQWDFFAEATDAEPRFQTPWHNWRRYGNILLSDDRGQRRHTDIGVLDELPEGVLERPAPVDWASLVR